MCGGGTEAAIGRGSTFATPAFDFFSVSSTSTVALEHSLSFVSVHLDSCSACAPGTYKSVDSTAGCADCAPGSYSSLPASISCGSCPAGMDSPASSDSYESCICPAGFFLVGDSTQAQPCAPCPAGTFKATNGSSACEQCRPGTQTQSHVRACFLTARARSCQIESVPSPVR